MEHLLKRKNKFTLLLMSTILLVGCSQSNQRKAPSGIAKFHESIDDGIIKKVLTIDDRPIWYFEERNKKGDLIYLSQVNNSVKYPVFRFYDNGHLNSWVFRDKEKAYGNNVIYWPDGALQRYQYCVNDTPLFQVNYDSLGRYVEHFGRPIIKVDYKKPLNFSSRDTIFLEIVNPPSISKYLLFGIFDRDSIMINKEFIQPKSNTIKYDYAKPPEGSKGFVFKYVLTNPETSEGISAGYFSEW